MRISIFLVAFLSFQTGIAQSIGIGTASPHPSAGLEIKSTNQGILVPRLTAVQRSTINNPATGLLVFQTDGTPGFYYYAGGGWINLTNGVPVNAEGMAGSDGFTFTLAGSGVSDDVIDAGAWASFKEPVGIAVDASGNVFISDKNSHKIKKITSDGVVTTFAGTGEPGEVNGPGAGATFQRPAGLVIDASGNIYVADDHNNVIRKITPQGEVSTFAGEGSSDSTNGPRETASFFQPRGVAVDALGNVYVADTRNHKIRKIATDGMVSTLAGGVQGDADGTGGDASFSSPEGIAVDAAGNVIVADRVNNKIKKITQSGVVTTMAGSTGGFADGPLASALFNRPTGLTIDAPGNIYVGDAGNNRIRKITPQGIVSTLAGSGLFGDVDNTGTAARFASPGHVAVDALGNVYVVDTSNYKIKKIIAR